MAQPVAPKGQVGQDWSTGLCGCFSDCGICCYGFCCPCCLYGDIVKKTTQAQDSCGPCCIWYLLQTFTGCNFCVSGPTRRQIRGWHQIRETPCNDYCVHIWCSGCALCQEARELKLRGAPQGAYVVPVGAVAMSAPPSQRMGAGPSVPASAR